MEYNSIYRGQVAETDAASGRLRVMVPSVPGGPSLWAPVCTAPGGSGGFKTGQTVWVMFEGGNENYPVVMGVLPAQ